MNPFYSLIYLVNDATTSLINARDARLRAKIKRLGEKLKAKIDAEVAATRK